MMTTLMARWSCLPLLQLVLDVAMAPHEVEAVVVAGCAGPLRGEAFLPVSPQIDNHTALDSLRLQRGV